ncbi:MAG TPA: hypothetical protein VEU33_12315 [Archangium sp.]|nr:hypothetical protein [Archangium sp.]
MSQPTNIGDVIAEREFEFLQSGQTQQVRLLIGRPRRMAEPDSDWTCPFQIQGLGDEQIREACGVDAVQAIMLCLRMAGALLEHHQERGLDLTWLEQKELGLPKA